MTTVRGAQVIRGTFSFNLWRNKLKELLLVLPPRAQLGTQQISVLQVATMLRKVDPSSTVCNNFFQLATLKFVAWKVEHAVVIRRTTLFNLQCNNVARKLTKMLPVLALKLTRIIFKSTI